MADRRPGDGSGEHTRARGVARDLDAVAASDDGRPVAPGGWRRALIGLVVGALAGAAIAFVLPRDDLPRRRASDPRGGDR